MSFRLLVPVPAAASVLPPRQESDSLPLLDRSGLLSAISSESIQGTSDSLNWEDQTLVEPEISGLWNKGYKAHEVPALIRDVTCESPAPDLPRLRGGSAGMRPGPPVLGRVLVLSCLVFGKEFPEKAQVQNVL